MASDQQFFQDALRRKYDILQQQADAGSQDAASRAQSVAQQPVLQQMHGQFGLDEQKLRNTGQMGVAGLNFALGQAQLGLEGVKAAAEDQYRRASLTKPQSVYDPETGMRQSTPGFNWALDFPKLGLSPLQTYLDKARTPMFAAGGRPPVNKPFIVGEKGPELFIPGDGSEPVVVGTRGPTVMTVPKGGEVVPNEEAQRMVSGGGGLADGRPTGSASAPPWANAQPGSAGRGLSPEGVVLPREAAQPGFGLPSGSSPEPSRQTLERPGGETAQAGGLRYVNLGQDWRQGQEAARQAYLAAENAQPEFSPAGTIDTLGKLNLGDRQKLLAGLSQEQLEALAQHRLLQKNFEALPIILGKRPAGTGSSSSGRVATPEAQAAIDDAMGRAVETGDATYNPAPGLGLFPDGFQIEGSLARLINSRRAAGEARAGEVDAENAAMRARGLNMARRALGLGSYIVVTPDTASFRR